MVIHASSQGRRSSRKRTNPALMLFGLMNNTVGVEKRSAFRLALRRSPWRNTLRFSLKRKNKEVEWIELEGEGHGIYQEKNQLRFYEALFKLFERTIGPGAPVAGAAR